VHLEVGGSKKLGNEKRIRIVGSSLLVHCQCFFRTLGGKLKARRLFTEHGGGLKEKTLRRQTPSQ